MTLGGWQQRDPEGLHGLNRCVSCEEAFSCLSAFDAHVDSNDVCLHPSEVGLEPFYYKTGRTTAWRWPVSTNKRNDDRNRPDLMSAVRARAVADG